MSEDKVNGGWHPVINAPVGRQLMAWEPMYGWLIVARDTSGNWTQKSSGNYWADLPVEVARSLLYWQDLPDSPEAGLEIQAQGQRLYEEMTDKLYPNGRSA